MITAAVCAMALLACVPTAFSGDIVYVDDDAPPAGDGQSWDTAYQSLQNALGYAADPNNEVIEVRVAQGRYTPDERTGDQEASAHAEEATENAHH